MIPSGPGLPRIGAPATSALAAVGVTSLEQVATMQEADLTALHGVGPKAIRLLNAAMAERGLAFRDDGDGDPAGDDGRSSGRTSPG